MIALIDKNETYKPALTQEEKAQLRIWLSTTTLQRLTWLEEAQKIAEKSGALKRYLDMSAK